jgi:hypothetical protein
MFGYDHNVGDGIQQTSIFVGDDVEKTAMLNTNQKDKGIGSGQGYADQCGFSGPIAGRVECERKAGGKPAGGRKDAGGELFSDQGLKRDPRASRLGAVWSGIGTSPRC